MIGFDPLVNERLCMTLLHSLWQVALLLMLAGGMRLLLGRKREQVSYLIHVAALFLALLALPLTYFLLAPAAPALANETPVATTISQLTETETVPQQPAVAIPMTTAPAASPIPVASNPPRVGSPKEVAAAPVARSWKQLTPWIVVCYVIGVLTMLIRLAYSAIRVEQMRMAATSLKEGPAFQSLQKLSEAWSLSVAPLLAHGEQVIVPKVVGLLKPTILLPTSALTGMRPEDLELILAHELAHVRRHDLWVNLLQRIAESVLFFNPAMWWLSRRISTLREYCCDDLACAAMTGSTTKDELELRYAQVLLQCVQLNGGKHVQQVSALAASGNSPSELRRRVARLFGEPLREPLRLSRGGLLILLLGVLILTSPWVWSKETEAVNDDDKEATRRLHVIVIQDSDQIEGLIKEGADIDDVDSQGTTPLCKAVQFSKLASVNKLLAAGADPNIASESESWTALHYAVQSGKPPELSRAILDAGAKINRRSSKGDTALQFAVSGGSAELVDLLLAKGANPAQRNHLGIRPIDQINAIAEDEAKKIQAVFQSHGFDSKRRPKSFAYYVDNPKKATMAGKFVLEDGSAAKVEAMMYYDTRTQSGAEGRFTGAFSLQVDAGTTWLQCYAEGFAPAWTEKVKLDSGTSKDDLEIVFRKGVSQVVRVVNENGDPIAGATLCAYPEIHGQQGGPRLPKKTDERGEYVLNHLANARHSFKIEANGYELLSEKHQLDSERTITLTMTAAAKATGIVRGADGQPLIGASIRISTESTEQGGTRLLSDSRKSSWWGKEYAVTDGEGRFVLDRLTRGAKYLAIVEAADGARTVVHHSIEAGKDTQIVMPERRDLIVEFEGDIKSLKRGKWEPRVSVRQRVLFKPQPGESFGALFGGSAVIEATPGGGRATYRGLGVDQNSTLEQQKVEVYLGNKGYPRQVVSINPEGDTVVKFLVSPKAGKPKGAKMPDEKKDDKIVWGKARGDLIAGAKLLSATGTLEPGDPVVVQFVLKNTSDKEQEVVLRRMETSPVLGENNRLELNVLGSSQERALHKLAPGEVLEDAKYRATVSTEGMPQGEYRITAGSAFWMSKEGKPNQSTGIPFSKSISFTLGKQVVDKKTSAKPPAAEGRKIGWGDPAGNLLLGMRLLDGRETWPNDDVDIEGQLFLYNAGEKPLELTYKLPNTPADWNMHVVSDGNKPVRLDSTWFSGMEPTRERKITIDPGKVVPLTGISAEVSTGGKAAVEEKIRGPYLKVLKEKTEFEYGDPKRLINQSGKFFLHAAITIRKQGLTDVVIVPSSAAIPFEISDDAEN